MIKLTIYGRLRKFIGQSSFEIKAKSAKEAFSFLINNFKGVREHMKDQEYCVMAGDLRLTEELLDMQTESDIKIVPVVHGEFLPFLLAGAAFGAAVQSAFLAVGVNMLISGVQDMFFPQPDPFGGSRQDDPQDQSYSFTGLLNNTKQGVPINIIYGEMLVGSTIVSSSVDTFQVTDEDD